MRHLDAGFKNTIKDGFHISVYALPHGTPVLVSVVAVAEIDVDGEPVCLREVDEGEGGSTIEG